MLNFFEPDYTDEKLGQMEKMSSTTDGVVTKLSRY